MFHALLAALLLAAPSPPPAAPAPFVPPPILMYHRIDVDRPADAVGRQLTVSPADFAAQLQYLRERGIEAISMAQLLARLQRHEPVARTVVITFDDGYADQYVYALPLLREYRASATFYVVTGELGRPRHLTWSEVESMAGEGMDIAAHGVLHDDLSQLTPAQQLQQIDGSIAALEGALHRPVDSYAYPSGRFNRVTLELVRLTGIPFAVTTDRVYVLPPENRFEMTRLRVRSGWSLRQFGEALEAAQKRTPATVQW